MGKSSELEKVTKRVLRLLQEKPQTRNSDNVLYYEILSEIGRENGIDIEKISLQRFLLNLKEFGFPPFETVRRSRQKVQEKHPELAACDAVEGQRILNEQVFRDYARG